MAYPISLSILGGTTIDLCEHSNSLCKINNWLFRHTYNGTYYREQTAQNISHKRLNRSMTRGNVYSIYIDPKHPAVFILAKKIKIGTIVSIILGLFIFTYGIDLLLKFLPMLLSR